MHVNSVTHKGKSKAMRFAHPWTSARITNARGYAMPYGSRYGVIWPRILTGLSALAHLREHYALSNGSYGRLRMTIKHQGS